MPVRSIRPNDERRWNYGQHTLDTVFTLVPFASFNVRAGLRFYKQDAVEGINGDTSRGTRRSWYYAPVFTVTWKPIAPLRITGELEHRSR